MWYYTSRTKTRASDFTRKKISQLHFFIAFASILFGVNIWDLRSPERIFKAGNNACKALHKNKVWYALIGLAQQNHQQAVQNAFGIKKIHTSLIGIIIYFRKIVSQSHESMTSVAGPSRRRGNTLYLEGWYAVPDPTQIRQVKNKFLYARVMSMACSCIVRGKGLLEGGGTNVYCNCLFKPKNQLLCITKYSDIKSHRD